MIEFFSSLENLRELFSQLRSPEVPCKNPAVLPDQEVVGESLDTVDQDGVILEVIRCEHISPGQFVVADRFDPSENVLVQRDAEYVEPLVFEIIVRLNQDRVLLAARATPGGPKIEQDNAPRDI